MLNFSVLDLLLITIGILSISGCHCFNIYGENVYYCDIDFSPLRHKSGICNLM